MLRRERDLIIADNEPYFVSDETDYTIPHHAEARSLLHVEIEIRQDLVKDEAGQAEWAARIARVLQDAEREFDAADPREMKRSSEEDAPSLFVSHGAPTFALEPGLLGPKLNQLGERLPDLTAVAVISAHWQTARCSSDENRGARNPA